MLTASFVIPCKGRLQHLKETIHCKMNQETEYKYDIMIVDYNCPDKTYEWVLDKEETQLRTMVVPADIDYFNNSHCRNCGALYTEGDILVFSDADCFLHEYWLDHVMKVMEHDSTVLGFGNDYQKDDGQKGRGTWAVRRWVWEKLRGYDEQMEGWGAEELDFFWRMQTIAQNMGAKIESFCRDWCWTIDHGDNLRTRFYVDKIKDRSNRINFQHRTRRRVINPRGLGNLDRNVVDRIKR